MMNMAMLKKAMFVGFVATCVMTAFSFVAPFFHLPHTDYHGMISAVMPLGMMGSWVAYFAVGIALAYFYAMFFRDRLPAHSWMRGMLYGFFMWLFVSFVFMPMMGMGMMGGSTTAMMGMFFGMMAYGATVGFLYAQE